jgi:hypothetical protein
MASSRKRAKAMVPGKKRHHLHVYRKAGRFGGRDQDLEDFRKGQPATRPYCFELCDRVRGHSLDFGGLNSYLAGSSVVFA